VKSEHDDKTQLKMIIDFSIATFFISAFFLHLMDPGLDPMYHTVSEYALGGFRTIAWLTFSSVGSASAALAVLILVGGTARGPARLLGSAAMTVTAVGSFCLPFFPTDIGWPPVTINGKIHAVAALGAMGAFALAMIAAGITSRHSPALAWASFASAAVLIFCLTLTFLQFIPGFFERALLVVGGVWIYFASRSLTGRSLHMVRTLTVLLIPNEASIPRQPPSP
jgi:hypothetical protein